MLSTTMAKIGKVVSEEEKSKVLKGNENQRFQYFRKCCIFVILESYVMMICIDLIGTSVGSLMGKETNSISSRLRKELLI